MGLARSEGMADAIGDAAVVQLREAVHGEGGTGDVAAETLAADVVAGGDADAGVDVPARVLRRPPARATALGHIVGLGAGAVVGFEISATPFDKLRASAPQASSAAGSDGSWSAPSIGPWRRLPGGPGAFPGEALVAQQTELRQAPQHAAPDRLHDPGQVARRGGGHAAEADVAGWTAWTRGDPGCEAYTGSAQAA